MTDPYPILLLHGTDELAILEHLKKLRTRLDPSTADMNLARLDGHSLDFEALNNAVNAIPFLSPLRLVILSNPSTLNRGKLIELLDKAPPTTLLALVEKELLKSDHWLVKWAQKAKAEIRVYAMPKRWEMPRWIESEAKKQGGRIEPEAAARLAEMTGEDTRIAAQEITKLLTYVDYKRPISESDVERVSVVTSQGNIFELVDALGTGDGKKAQRVLHKLLDEEDPLEFWGMIIRQFRLILLAREILDGHGSTQDMQKELGLRDFVAEKVVNQARRFTTPALEAIYHKLLEIDEGAKTSRVPLDLALDALVVELTRR